MGCRTRIVAWAASSELAERACRAAFERFAELEDVASDWRPTSEASRLGTEPKPVSDHLWRLLTAACEAWRDTSGAFDPTVGPLTRLWRRGEWSQGEAATARALVGAQGLTLEGGRAWFDRKGMALDLGAIAKGDACDQALAVLDGLGVESALVESGGDLAVSGPPPGRPGWAVRLADGSVVTLAHRAVSTSGTVSQERAGIGHLVHPGRGLEALGGRLVSVLGRRAIETEPWSTALALEGPRLEPAARARGLEVVWAASRPA